MFRQTPSLLSPASSHCGPTHFESSSLEDQQRSHEVLKALLVEPRHGGGYTRAQGSFPLCDSRTLPRELLKLQQYQTISKSSVTYIRDLDLPGKAEIVLIRNQNERKTPHWKSETQNGNLIIRHLI